MDPTRIPRAAVLRSRVIASALIGLFAFTSPAVGVSAVHLAWNDCYQGPTASPLKTFLCDSDTARFRLVASFVADSSDSNFNGFGAWVDFGATGGGTLPDWWQLQSGGCRDGDFMV